mgnify:FL=1
MNEERKEYSIVGQVTIGTDEYRDLIEAVKEAENEAREYRKESSDRYWEIDKLKKEVESLKQYKEFVVEKCLDSYKLWKLENEQEEE